MDEKGPLQMQQPLCLFCKETDTRCASDKLLEHALVRSQSVGEGRWFADSGTFCCPQPITPSLASAIANSFIRLPPTARLAAISSSCRGR